MRAILATIVLIIIGLVLGAGILSLMKGSFWLLVVGGLAYVIAFARWGCLHH